MQDYMYTIDIITSNFHIVSRSKNEFKLQILPDLFQRLVDEDYIIASDTELCSRSKHENMYMQE